MIFLGVDPDLHTTAMAWWNTTPPALLRVHVIRSKSSVQSMIQAAVRTELLVANYYAFAVESQELYLGKTPDARSILHLAQVAGGLMANCFRYSQIGYFPRPFEWKGQQAKLPHQIKILAKAGIVSIKTMGGKDPYAVPQNVDHIPGASDLNPGDWKHVVDAIGLAQYAADTYQYQQAKQVALAEARK